MFGPPPQRGPKTFLTPSYFAAPLTRNYWTLPKDRQFFSKLTFQNRHNTRAQHGRTSEAYEGIWCSAGINLVCVPVCVQTWIRSDGCEMLRHKATYWDAFIRYAINPAYGESCRGFFSSSFVKKLAESQNPSCIPYAKEDCTVLLILQNKFMLIRINRTLWEQIYF